MRRILFIFLALMCGTQATRSHKKGLCIPPGDRFHCGDLEAFSRVSWWYNWHTQPNHNVEGHCTCETAPDCGEEPAKPKFVPMIWGYHEDNPYHDDESDPVADKYPIILGFNEPNREDQSDIDPVEAAEAWVEIQNMYPDKILVSPAPAGGNTHWFDPFFEACEELGCRIDYLATHDYAGGVDDVMDRLKDLHHRYGRKIWLTEFALCCTRDIKEVEEFARGIIPRLEEADYVYKYSWFITRWNNKKEDEKADGDWYLDKVNALFVEDSMELSSVGKIYNNH